MMEAIPADGRFQRNMVSEVIHSSRDGFSLFLANQSVEVKMGEGDLI